MKRNYIYKLTYDIPKGDDVYSSFLLGFFDKKTRVQNAIEQYKTLPGFKENGDCFNVCRYFVKRRKVEKIYCLNHECFSEKEDVYVVTDCGIYFTEKKALRKLSRLKNEYPFNLFVDGFTVDTCEINKMEWTEGFDLY